MSQREDVELITLAQEFCPGKHLIIGGHQECVGQARDILASDWLAAHDEAVRVSERVRLAGEVEALADLRRRMTSIRTMCELHPRKVPTWELRAALPVPGVRLTEEE